MNENVSHPNHLFPAVLFSFCPWSPLFLFFLLSWKTLTISGPGDFLPWKCGWDLYKISLVFRLSLKENHVSLSLIRTVTLIEVSAHDIRSIPQLKKVTSFSPETFVDTGNRVECVCVSTNLNRLLFE